MFQVDNSHILQFQQYRGILIFFCFILKIEYFWLEKIFVFPNFAIEVYFFISKTMDLLCVPPCILHQGWFRKVEKMLATFLGKSGRFCILNGKNYGNLHVELKEFYQSQKIQIFTPLSHPLQINFTWMGGGSLTFWGSNRALCEWYCWYVLGRVTLYE